jgi:error-prone DNA polymerase
MSYVELHCHSNFSFLDGASHPEALVERAASLGYRALALTDHSGLYGAVRFHEAARRHSIKPLFGAEITLDSGHHLVLLIRNATGYSNLCRLASSAIANSKKGDARVSLDMIALYAQGLIALSGCRQGEVPTLILEKKMHEAEQAACRYREIFGPDNFYLELQHHHLPQHEVLCEARTMMGRRLGIPRVATNNVHHTTPDGRRLQDVLTCIRNHTTLDQAGDLLYPNAERFLKPPEAMTRRFARWPEAIENTLAIAERCEFTFAKLATSLPDFPVPDGNTTFGYLRRLVYEGAQERYGEPSSTVRAQLEHELRIIEKLNLAGYFLIVWDITRFCREKRILCQGRGSAANSAVCYCLGVTAVDPIKLKLLFERFLSEERKEAPDIDIDIANNRREEVIQYVYAKYGREHAAMVCEVISYRGRSAVREVGKALGFSVDEVNKLSKLMDHYSEGVELEKRVQEAGLKVQNRRVRLLVDLCQQIRGFPRHLGIHVGGMIVTKRPLSEIVPIENATMPNRTVIQWDKDDAQDVGLIKIDLLGLGMLSLVDEALRLVKERHGVTVDPAKLTYHDPKVYDLMCKADTVGVFQIESRAQMNTLPRHKPRCFYDLVVEVALIRPGPIQGDMVHPYLRRRNGEEQVTYPHPSLEPILARTLGVPLFQEQGMQVAVAAAGFTASQADELRRAMGHKRSKEKMEALSMRLITGMMKNGIPRETAHKIFDQLAAFADFGFAESHAASFALLVYVSAYLKVYYPQEFYCALLNSQPMGFYSPSTIVYEARRRGMRILAVDLSKSSWDCTVEGDKVRIGLKYVKGLKQTAKEKIERERTREPFRSIEDFVLRTELGEGALRQLALAGAFRGFGLTRRQALWKVLALRHRSKNELSLQSEDKSLSLIPPMFTSDALVADFKTMDLSTGPHPMLLFRSLLSERGAIPTARLAAIPDHQYASVAGLVVIRQMPGTAKGFLFITLEDETGFANVVVKPAMVARFRRVVVSSTTLLVRGTVEKQDGVINVIGEEFFPMRFNQDQVAVHSRDFR